jgi:hypothetical protein
VEAGSLLEDASENKLARILIAKPVSKIGEDAPGRELKSTRAIQGVAMVCAALSASSMTSVIQGGRGNASCMSAFREQ